MQCQKAVLFTLQVSRYCLLDFQGRIVIRVPMLALLFSMTQCVLRLIEAFITVASKCRRRWPEISQSLRLLQVFKLACFSSEAIDNLYTSIRNTSASMYLFIYYDSPNSRLTIQYNTLYTGRKMHYYTIGWDMASDMQYQ